MYLFLWLYVPLTIWPVCGAWHVFYYWLYIRMVSNYYERGQVSPEYLRTLLAQWRGLTCLLLLILTVCFRCFSRDLKDIYIYILMSGRVRTLTASNTLSNITKACLKDNLSPQCGSLRSGHGRDVDLIIRVCFRGLALHHYLVPAGHYCGRIHTYTSLVTLKQSNVSIMYVKDGRFAPLNTQHKLN